MKQLEKKFGMLTAISMVVGIVIGVGVLLLDMLLGKSKKAAA